MPPRKSAAQVIEEAADENAVEPIEVGETVEGDGYNVHIREPRIFGAFIAAQGEIGNVAKNAKNDFFKNSQGKPSKFVDLAALNDAVLPVLTKYGLGFQQRMEFAMDRAFVVSQVFHTSGESMPESWYPVITKDGNDPQKFGAGVTYARRYAMMAYFSIAAEDDDGNTAAKPPAKTAKDELKAELTKMKANPEKFKEFATTAQVKAEKFADLSEEDAKKILAVVNAGVPF